MEETKLIKTRTQTSFTQQQVAEHLCMDISNYNRREKGTSKISNNEWEKLSKLFDVPLEDFYENEESIFIICKEQSVGIVNGTNTVYTVPEFLLESQIKYIQKLEEEIETLKRQLYNSK